MSYSFRSVGNNFVWSSWENSLLKKCGCSRCQTLWLCWGKFVSFYVTSGFSSETHNSCRLICLRFNPVKMSKWKRHFLFYILLVELVTKGVFKLLWILVFGRLKLKIAQLNEFNGSDFIASHMFLSATAWDLRRSFFFWGEKAF